MIRTADVGDEVPAFNLDSQMGRIAFHEIIDGKWCLLVTFCSAFEPVATTDFGMLAKLAEEFEARNIFVVAVGNDSGERVVFRRN
jgi:alkyl hydroperoxide reductase subunit AhpC